MLYNINYARKISSVACQARILWAVHWQIIDNIRIEGNVARPTVSPKMAKTIRTKYFADKN